MSTRISVRFFLSFLTFLRRFVTYLYTAREAMNEVELAPNGEASSLLGPDTQVEEISNRMDESAHIM